MKSILLVAFVLLIKFRGHQTILVPQDFLAKEAMIKVWASCIGESLATEFELQVKDAVNQCKFNNPNSKTDEHFDSSFKGNFNSENTKENVMRDEKKQKLKNDRRFDKDGRTKLITDDRFDSNQGISYSKNDDDDARTGDEGSDFWSGRKTKFGSEWTDRFNQRTTNDTRTSYLPPRNNELERDRTRNEAERNQFRTPERNRDTTFSRDKYNFRDSVIDTNKDDGVDKWNFNKDNANNKDVNFDRDITSAKGHQVNDRDRSFDKVMTRNRDDIHQDRDFDRDVTNNRDLNDRDRDFNRDDTNNRDFDDRDRDVTNNRDFDDRDRDVTNNRDFDDRDNGSDSDRNTTGDRDNSNTGKDKHRGNYFNQRRIPNIKRISSKFDYKKPYRSSGISPSLTTSDLDEDIKPVYFTLIDQVPFLLQNDRPSSIVRKKRQSNDISRSRFSVQELMDGENELRAHLSNFSCVLKTLNLVNAAGDLKMSTIFDNVGNLPIHPDLKKDLQDVIEDCAQLTSCQPLDDDETLVPRKLELAMAFFKCSENRRQMACMKKDIRESLRKEIPKDRQSTFNMERTVKRIMHIKMKDHFADFMTALS